MSISIDGIYNTVVDTDNTVCNLALVCRGCLKKSGEMKNIYEWGLDNDFFSYTDIPRNPSEGMPQLLCEGCEANLQNVKSFKNKCQQSDKILRSNLKKKITNHNPVHKTQVTTVLRNKKLLFVITAPDPNDKISLQCPHKQCNAEFYKKIHLLTHLRKAHKISNDFEIEQQFYCTENNCNYNLNSNPKKYFTGRKFLNQHYHKTHNDKVFTCDSCNKKFSRETDYYRHVKSCNLMYECPLCAASYSSNESYLVHLMRKHPELHAKYKEEKKAKKRSSMTNEEEMIMIDIEKATKIRKESIFDKTIDKETNFLKNRELNNTTRFPPLQLNVDVFESEIPPIHCITNTVSDDTPYVAEEHTIQDNVDEKLITDGAEDSFAENLTVAEDYVIGESANEETTEENQEEYVEPRHIITERSVCTDVSNEIDGFKKSSATQIPEDITNDVSLTAWSNKNDFEFQNEMSTQTVFEDLLSMKSQHSEDEIFFSESVSLTDIQTQTAPFEFGLIRCNKETQSCTSQTQSPDLSIKETQTCFCHFDSPRYNFRHFDSLSSSPASSNFISTETQTSDFRTPVRSDVLLSFSSAETQTCFEESNNDM